MMQVVAIRPCQLRRMATARIAVDQRATASIITLVVGLHPRRAAYLLAAAAIAVAVAIAAVAKLVAAAVAEAVLVTAAKKPISERGATRNTC